MYDRIDHIIGVERYDDETPPKVHYTAPGSAGGGGDAGAGHRRLPLGLHVDTNSTGTYATAILYLTTLAQPDADGATVFPCAAPALLPVTLCGDGGEAKAKAARAAAAGLLSDEVLHTASVPAYAPKGTRRHADVLRHAAERGQGLSVFPEMGKLVIFFTRGDDGLVDPLSFHGGAAVGTGGACACGAGEGPCVCAGKWMLQVCKEVPAAMRSAAGTAAFVSARRGHVCLYADGSQT